MDAVSPGRSSADREISSGLDASVVAVAVETGRLAPAAAAAVGDGAPAALDRLREMARATGVRRRELRDRFIADHGRLFRLLAHRLCRNLGLQPELRREDVEQIIALGAGAWVDELMDHPAAIEGIVSFEDLLHVRSRASVRSWADRELSPAFGMTLLRRRVRKLNELRDELRAATGAEPTAAAVAQEHGRRLAAARADARRQGMLARRVLADELGIDHT